MNSVKRAAAIACLLALSLIPLSFSGPAEATAEIRPVEVCPFPTCQDRENSTCIHELDTTIYIQEDACDPSDGC